MLTKTTHILFIDIDSEFKKDFNISFSEGFSVQAIKRKEEETLVEIQKIITDLGYTIKLDQEKKKDGFSKAEKYFYSSSK